MGRKAKMNWWGWVKVAFFLPFALAGFTWTFIEAGFLVGTRLAEMLDEIMRGRE
jgi:hypothetical protein